MDMLNHLLLVPIVLPLLMGSALILIDIRRRIIKFSLNLFSMVILLLSAAYIGYLTQTHFTHGIAVYATANWSTPFAITLWSDTLVAVMLLLTALLAIVSLIFSWSKWSRAGIHFHALLQFLLMGINGILLTADIFNLFVFFEIMLAASYGLILHAYNNARIRAGLQYLAINLVGSCFFLIGIALIYAATGSLNMADIANHISALEGTHAVYLKIGCAMLAVAFFTKSAIWPLGFWLPTTYSACSAPVAALIALMTKIGFIVILRLWLLVFSHHAGAFAFWGSHFIFYAGIVTLWFGIMGLLASQDSMRMASYYAVISSGLLLSSLGLNQQWLIHAILFYFISSTLVLAAFILLTELIDRIKTPSLQILAITMEAFAVQDERINESEEAYGFAIPSVLAILGIAFVLCALILTGMPPLSGFVGKFALLKTALTHSIADYPIKTALFFFSILSSGLAGIIAFMRFGVRSFWTITNKPPRIALTEILPIYFLVFVCISLTIFAEFAFSITQHINTQLQQPEWYIERVLTP